VPALGYERPTGKRLEKPVEVPKPKEALEVNFSPEPVAASPAQRVHAVVTALQEQQLDAAVEGYAQVPESVDGWFSIESLVTLGQVAVGRGQLHLAVRALKQAAKRAPDDPLAPKACILLARVYAEKLGDAASAGKLYRYVLQRYPGTDAARFAEQRLAG
jgi:TolA-binding protein